MKQTVNRFLLHFIMLLAVLLFLNEVAWAAEPVEEANTKGSTGMPLPRFASLKVDEANLRTGPGTRYPIEWVFVRDGVPVEITAEFDVWRRVRDSEGSQGWVHKNALSGKRSLIITGGTRNIFKNEEDNSALCARIESGAIGHLLSCQLVWCKVKVGSVKGYMRKADFWGAYPDETFN